MQEQEHSVSSFQPTTDEWTQLRNATQTNPYNEALWDRLLDKAEESGDLERIKEAYEALLEKYPNNSSAQISYLNHFLVNPATFPFAEGLFARYLRSSVSVDLWRFYIVYVRRLNTTPTTRDTVSKAYDFALQHVGQDKDSSSIWEEYIQFAKSAETKSTWEEQQKMDNLRKIYQRAVQIPLENVEVLWKDYEAFENSLNRITAKKFLQDLSPAHMQARSKLRELRKFLGPLLPPTAPANGRRPPLNLPRKPTFSDEEKMTAGAWKRYLKWEESNPLELEDKAMLITRVLGVYRKTLERMRFFSEVWFMAYSWLSSMGRTDDAIGMLKNGIEVNPTSYVLNFALAEHHERAKNFTEVHGIYTNLLQRLQEEIEATEKRLGSASSAKNSESNAEEGGETKEGQNGVQKQDSQNSQATTTTLPSDTSNQLAEMEFREQKQEYGVVYIVYIRFAMRSEGLEASRAVFSKARRDKWAPWEVYEAAALMEYHVAKQLGVANRIFNRALERFKGEIEFVIRYLTFLMTVNDDNNARALFEQTVDTFPPQKARPLWERWARYEYQFGDLEAALKLEKRMAEVFPDDPPIKRFAQRHSYSTIDAIAFKDLGSPPSRKRAQQQAPMTSTSSSLHRTDTLPAVTSGMPPPPSSGQSAVYRDPSLSSIPGMAPTGGSGPSISGAYNSNNKRGITPERDLRRRGGADDNTKPGGRRARDHSPPSHLASRDRDRYNAAAGRRYGSPAGWAGDRDRFDRDRDRSRSPPARGPRAGGSGNLDRDRAQDNTKPLIPPVINWFVGQLPPPAEFDGPIFRTEDLMNLFRNVVIPATNPVRPRSPPSTRPTRPPPDYGPYRGPTGRGRY